MTAVMKKINEIFYSLQGEGRHTGMASVFVRFSGCNLRCGFCDTAHEEGRMMSDEDIVEAVRTFPGEWIILTGGEPTLWIDEEFVRNLKETTGKKVAIETNGSRRVPKSVDWVTVSPKMGMDGAGEYPLLAEHADELKVVDLGQPLEPYKDLACVDGDTLLYLQPCYVADPEECLRRRHETVRRVLENPEWTLSLQTHRILNIP